MLNIDISRIFFRNLFLYMYTEKIVISSETVLIRIDNEIIYWRRNNPCTVKGGELILVFSLIFA